MQYHIDSIPVWEAMETPQKCPICHLHQRSEAMEVERALGGSVMEPDVRVEVNRRGICLHHHQLLAGQHNKLGHALLTNSHCKELLPKLEALAVQAEAQALPKGRFPLRRGKAATPKWASQLEAYAQDCVLCHGLRTHMHRYLYTFIHLWKTDELFAQRFQASSGACLPHTAQLLRQAQQQLSPEKNADFAAVALRLLQQTLAQDEQDTAWFTQKFDYRNQDKPWGNSKDALERSIALLRGDCGQDVFPPERP